MNNLRWFNQIEFSDKLLKKFPDKVQETNFCEFNLKSKILEKLIPEIADDYVAPWTEPGTCLKWFGLFEDVYFQLTARIGCIEIADIQVFLPNSHFVDWQIFKVGKIPPFLVKKLTWIKEGSEDASFSLFCLDDDNLSYEFYRAKDENDANELKSYLIENHFRRKLFISNAENLKLNWVVEKEEKIVARYTSRYVCEKFAVRKSKGDESSYLVYSESASNKAISIFKKGKIVE